MTDQIVQSKHPPERVMRAICATNWAMLQDDLQVILDIASREHELDPQAVSMLMGKPLDNTEGVTIRNGVGIIPVIGPIFRYGSVFNKISGATSIDSLALDFNEALNNPNVKAILFEVDSPGGEVAGTGEFANMIYHARESSDKPIWAYISSLGASAAYWISSACEKVIVSPTSIVGSIGVVSAVRKPDPKDRTIEFVSSQSPNKRPNINTQEGRSQVQDTLDALADVFIGTVARNRNVEEATVIDDFGAGGVRVGRDAVKCGLADEVGTFEMCIATLASVEDVHPANVRPMRRIAENNTISMSERISQMGVDIRGSWKQFKALMDADVEEDNESTEAVTELTPVVASDIATPIVAKDATNVDELARLRADNMRMKNERWNEQATAFMNAAVTEGRAFPAEREAFIALFIQVSADDETLGGVSRVNMLCSAMSARPKHQLSAETLAPSLADLLRNGATKSSVTGNTQDDDGPVSDDTVRDLLSKSALGNSVLRSIADGKPLR